MTLGPAKPSSAAIRLLRAAAVPAWTAWAAIAAPAAADTAPPVPPEAWSLHAQATTVLQFHPSFHADYSGANSLDPGNSGRETFDAGLYIGARLRPGAEAYVDPEIDQGFGLSNTLGVAGFTSGEAYKVGDRDPYFRLPRWFVRQTFAAGETRRTVDAGPNQFGGDYPVDAVVVTAGKFSVVDVFDTNRYAHDPRGDFLNWSVIDSGAFDYAADAWGYSYGAAAEWTHGTRTLRFGGFALSRVPNSRELDPGFHQFALVGEAEQRHAAGGHPGAVRLLAYVNRGRMARYDEAIAAAPRGATPDVGPVRHFAMRPGMAVNVEQEVADGAGIFLRASINDGRHEAFEFTEINRSLCAGATVSGTRWGRAGDTLGVALVANGLSSAARDYLGAGGMGILIGDGALGRYGLERIVESYYQVSSGGAWSISADLQWVDHPAYNVDRGPVVVFGLRLHWSR